MSVHTRQTTPCPLGFLLYELTPAALRFKPWKAAAVDPGRRLTSVGKTPRVVDIIDQHTPERGPRIIQ